MKIFVQTIALAFLLVGVYPPVYAEGGCGLRYKVEHAEDRIQHGIDSGTLTPREVLWLEHERGEIRRMFQDMRENDAVNQDTCDALAERIERLNRHITELKQRNRDDSGYDNRYHY